MAAPATQAQAVDMLSSMVAQLTAGQRQQILQQFSLEMASDSSAAVERIADQEVLFEADISAADKFTVEQLTKKRRRNEKATQGQQTFAVSFNVKTVLHAWSDAISSPTFKNLGAKMFICVLLHSIEDII